jgi:hypothetical protein
MDWIDLVRLISPKLYPNCEAICCRWEQVEENQLARCDLIGLVDDET